MVLGNVCVRASFAYVLYEFKIHLAKSELFLKIHVQRISLRRLPIWLLEVPVDKNSISCNGSEVHCLDAKKAYKSLRSSFSEYTLM